MKYKLGFIGVGHMGGILAEAACKGTASLSEISLSERDLNVIKDRAEKLGCAVNPTPVTALESKYIILGVKPQNMAELFEEIGPILSTRQDRFIIVSMAAGVAISKIQTLAGHDYPVIRIMPNTPAAVSAGCILVSAASGVTDREVSEFTDYMKEAGVFVSIDEDFMDAGCAVSGCGPAFVYSFIQAMANAGENCGLPADKALMLSKNVVMGAAKLLIESGESPQKLKEEVCSPGGSTIEGVKVLDSSSFAKIVNDTVAASFKRNIELGK